MSWKKIKDLPVVGQYEVALELRDGEYIAVLDPNGIAWRTGWHNGIRYRQRNSAWDEA